MNDYERRLQKITREACEKEFHTRASSIRASSTNTSTPAPALSPASVPATATATAISTSTAPILIPAPVPRIEPPANSLSFSTLDVFTTIPFKGNPLAVVRIRGLNDLPRETKQTIAREFNYSETVFLHDPYPNQADAPRRLGIFTVHEELPFAGHPIIGAICYVCQYLEPSIDRLVVMCLAGHIAARYDRNEHIAEIDVPFNVRIHKETVMGRAVLKTQPYLARTSVITSELPVVSILKGMSFILINLPSVVPHMEKLEASGLSVDASSVRLDEDFAPSFIGAYFYAFTSHPNERITRIRTRMLEPSVGEDAATGSAACTLACYLALKDGRDKVYQYSIEQGIEMGRASDIQVRVTLVANGKDVQSVVLAGRAVLVTQGTLALPERMAY